MISPYVFPGIKMGNYRTHHIIKMACKTWGIAESEIITGERISQDHSMYKHIIFYILRKRGMKLKEIGLEFRNNHSTVVHGLRDIEYRINNYDMYKQSFEKVKMLIWN